MKEKIRILIRDIRCGIHNLFIWFPIIWKDHWWDQSYIYIILQFKLKIMEKSFRTDSNIVDCNKVADDIKYCRLLTERLINDDYITNALERYHKTWLEDTFEIDNDGLLKHNINSTKNKAFKRACHHSDAMKKQDLDELFKHLRKHIEYWWD